MKKIFSFFLTLALPFGLNAQSQCDLPERFTGNTGDNMTVMLTPDFINSLTISDPNAYFVAKAGDIVVGSRDVSGVSQTTIAIWGDDAQTNDVDGATSGQSISFQLVNGTDLYDVVMPTPVTYASSGLSIQASSANATLCVSAVPGCTDSSATNYNAEATEDDNSCEFPQSGLPDGWTSGLTVTDNNMSVVFPGALLTDYVGGKIRAVAGGNQVSEVFDVTSDGVGVPVIGTDSQCGCDYADWGENIHFEISLNDVITPVYGDPKVTYTPNLTNIIQAVSFSAKEPIVYSLVNGWNMVGYVGAVENAEITSSIDGALANNSSIVETFDIIKDVSGTFWTSAFAMLKNLQKGEGYMMYVKDGQSTDISFQEDGFVDDIKYDLSNGWNMVAFTGDIESNTSIESATNDALSGSSIGDTFDIIKDVSGTFWTSAFAMLKDYTPGQAYMMYVKDGQSTEIDFIQD